MIKNTKISAVREGGSLIIKPFDDSDLEVRIQIELKKTQMREFPHNMQLNNKQLLQAKYYHLFDGDVAIYIKDAEYINFSRLLFNIPFEKFGKPMKIIGYEIMNCNPHFTEEQLFECLHHIAAYYIQIPDDVHWLNAYILELGYIEFMKRNLERIKIGASQIFSTPFKGRIEKRNQVIYNPDYELKIEERTEIRNKVLGENRRKNRIEEIYSALLNWNSEEKPTQKNIATKLDVSVRTIKTYWKPAKDKLFASV